jgi:hypothetical protein
MDNIDLRTQTFNLIQEEYINLSQRIYQMAASPHKSEDFDREYKRACDRLNFLTQQFIYLNWRK